MTMAWSPTCMKARRGAYGPSSLKEMLAAGRAQNGISQSSEGSSVSCSCPVAVTTWVSSQSMGTPSRRKPGSVLSTMPGVEHGVIPGIDAGRLGKQQALPVAEPAAGEPLRVVEDATHVGDRLEREPMELRASQTGAQRVGHAPCHSSTAACARFWA